MFTPCRFFASICATFAVISSSASLFAAGALDLIPQDAAIVVKLKSPEGTITRVGNFANQIQPGLGFLVQGQAPALGVAISNPTLGGVDLKNDWYIAAFPKKDGEPDVVFIVPATDPEAMKEAVGGGFTFAVKGDWVAYSMNPEAAGKSQACIDGKSKSLTLGRRAGGLIDDNDISIFVNLSQLTDAYADELDQAEEELARGLEQFDPADAPPGIDADALRDIVQTFGQGLLQAVRDADAVAGGITFADDALTIDELLLVKSDSDSSKFLAGNPASDLALLGKLPQKELGYVAVHMDVEALTRWGMGMASSLMKDNSDARSMLDRVEKGLSNVEFGSFATGFGLNSDGSDGILKTVAITEATPASQVRDLIREISKLGSSFSTPGVEQEMTFEEGVETYGSDKADRVNVKQEFSPEVDPLGISQQMVDLFYGKEGATTRVVTRDAVMVQTTGGGQATMKEALASLDGGGASSGAVAEAREMALEKANMIAMIDLPNLLVEGAAAAAKTGLLPIPLPVEQLADIKIPASYLVISVGTEPDGLRARTALPVKMFKGFMEIQKFVQQMQQNQPPNGF
jgi:hypothetical protein